MNLETGEPAEPWPGGIPLPDAFNVRSLDGVHDLWGLLHRPAGFDAAKNYPVIEVIYGAPQTAVVSKSWMPSILTSICEQLAALGFVVVVIDGPGTPYRSHAFQLASHGRIESCGGLPDHAHAIRTLAASRPWMDLSRVGIVGGSGGGYAAVRAMAEFPDFYRVGVAMCGNHDQAAYIAGWGECYHGALEPELYARQSNVGVADRITGDLLLIHGEMDENVHPSMTLRVADAMIRANRAVDMLIVPSAGHDLGTMPYVQRRAFDWFVEKLMRRRPPRRRATK
jgi:dipeptidyl aminopeptidase/acylaminoacyl peptidase